MAFRIKNEDVMIHKHSELIVVGIVIFFALGGLFFMFTDNARTSDLFEQNTQYAKHSVVYPLVLDHDQEDIGVIQHPHNNSFLFLEDEEEGI